MCRYPKTIRNKDFGKKLKFGQDVPFMQVIKCQKCDQCCKDRQMEWVIRMTYELKRSTKSYFVTLTYDDKFIKRSFNGLLTCVTRDLQNYFKRLRKLEPNIKYYASSEYGEDFQRPHYHAIVFNVSDDRNLHKAWCLHGEYLGTVVVGDAEDASMKYVAGYIGKKIGIPLTDYDDRLPEFSLMSQGIGDNIIEYKSFYVKNVQGFTVHNGGAKYALPRRFKELIFQPYYEKTPTQRWIEYVNGLFKEYPVSRVKQIVKFMPKPKDFGKTLTFKNHLLNQISKQNYETFLEIKDRSIASAGSIMVYEKNQRRAAEIHNKKFESLIKRTSGQV